MQNRTASLKDCLVISYKTEHIHTIRNHAPWYLAKGDENLCPDRNLPMDVKSNFTHNYQNLGATKCPSVSE